MESNIMKLNLKIFVVIPVFLFFVKVSNAQNFLTQDKIWSDYFYTDRYDLYAEDGTYIGWTTAEITSWYKVGTDSLIAGKRYKQILSSRDSTMENWQSEAFMREEEDKVFRYYPVGKSEILLYDFGMQLGDTLFDANGWVATVLETVRDTVMDKTRKLFIFSKYMYDSYLQKYDDSYKGEEAWIEGIGALRGGLFRPLSDFMTGSNGFNSIGYYGLICFSENGKLVYHHPDFDKCYYHEICSPPCEMHIPKIEADFPFKLIQQKGKIEIQLNGLDVKQGVACIYSIDGRLLDSKRFQDNSNIDFSTSGFSNGVYIVLVRDIEIGRAWRKKIIV